MNIHQSSLKSYARCGEQHRRQMNGERGEQLSATAFGSVMHHALHTLERSRDLQAAINTFEYYWHPHNIEEVCEPVTEWIAKQSYSSLLQKGRETIKRYWDLKMYDDEEVLALEFPFAVELTGTTDRETGKPHMLLGTVDRLAVRAYRRQPHLCLDDWKGLCRNTPIPTPDGWSTMGALRVGDLVFGTNGEPCRVTAKSGVHERPCYRVTFDDGSSVVTDNVHLWEVHAGRRGEHVRVMSTEALANGLFGSNGERDKRIPNPSPLALPDADVPIDPYVLGVWIGDGSRGAGEVTKPDEDLWQNIRARGYSIQETDYKTRTIYGLRKQLRLAGLLGHKHIPDVYLRASSQQRLDLLRGLMDTDGTWNRVRHQASFTTVDKALAEQVRELIVSFGWKARVWELTKRGFGKVITAYDITFTPDRNPFALPRKANLAAKTVAEPPALSRRRHMVSIVPVPTVPTQCIQVDADDSLYLCGEQMVPTHNTGKKALYLKHHMQFTAYAYASTRPEFWVGNSEYMTEGFGIARGSGLWDRFANTPRHGWWINVMGGPDWNDAGLREVRDYKRLMHSVDTYVRAIQNDIFPLNMDGSTCAFCPFRDDCPEGIDRA